MQSRAGSRDGALHSPGWGSQAALPRNHQKRVPNPPPPPPQHGDGCSPGSPRDGQSACSSVCSAARPRGCKAMGLPWWHIPKLEPKPAWRSFPRRKGHPEVRQRTAMCSLSGIASSPSSAPVPSPVPQHHAQPRVCLHPAAGKVLGRCPPRRGVWPQLLTFPEPLPALSIPQTWSCVPAQLPRLGVPSVGSPPRAAPGEGRSEGCPAAGEGLKRNYSLHKNIPSSQGP